MYLHVDLDAFFASVEVLDNPELKGKPLIVGGLPGERRSVVSTCSYEARKYGIHSAMPVNRAYELCPQAIFVHGRMQRYHEKSQEVMSVFREFSPDVFQMSVDEAFIDITGTEMLFGPPENLAKTLKQRVLEKTGLTVSVGIASNRYVAKIASGLKKPDGLCYVPEGQEEQFMLSLPLDKLWGIGTKSRERLNGCGIFTIPEIHSISETALKELFGEASGTFLYKSVRGMDVEHFGDETKSRSLSAERTFCFDLSDMYSIETELLHLSYDVMFRVLHEKVNSKTVSLKIRYEDFTTVTVTESSSRIVSSIEDLFERSCRLFQKKYERGRGIRLLGLGLQNLNDGLESEQAELFDFGEKKQRSVEQTVLKLHQKNPSAKLKKARQFITSVLMLFFLTVPLSLVHANDIEFDIEGSWESLLSSGAAVYLGEEAPVLSIQSPVFTQKADLLLWFMYDNHWYFDASISSDTDTNKIAAGYSGDGIIQEVRIGTDIGTEDMSPGVQIVLQGSNWDADTQLHLDSVQTHSKTWKGGNELITSTIPLSSFKKGVFFSTVNTSTAANITGLYIEDSEGPFRDSSSRRYKRLSKDEYLMLPSKGLIYLATPATGAVIAEITDKSSVESELPAYLKDVCEWFGDRGPESTYTLMGLSCSDDNSGPSVSETAPLFTTVTSGTQTVQGLYLSKPGLFSPFQVASFYEDSFQNNSGSITISSRSLYADYSYPALLNESASLIQLHSSESQTVNDYSAASVRFPAAQQYPELYLPSKGITDNDTPYMMTTSTQASEAFSIGSKAIENSVRVLKNGIAVPSSYDRTTGNVTLSVPYSSADTIFITWNEYSSTSNATTLSLGAVFHHYPTQYLKTTGLFDSTLFLDTKTHSLSSSTEAPYASISLETEWERPFGNITLSASNTLSVDGTFSVPEAKVPVLAFSGDGNEAVWFLGESKSSTDVPEVKSRTENASVPVLSEERRQSFSLESVKISKSSGYTVTIEGAFSQNAGGTPYWYAAEIPLSQGASSLPSSHVFSFCMQDLKKLSTDYDVYLKLGETLWCISSTNSQSPASDVLSPFVLCADGYQNVRVLITDYDRQKLEANHDMSLIVINKSDTAGSDIKLELKGSDSALSGLSFNISAYNENGHSIRLPVTVSEVSFPVPFTENGWFQSSGSTPHAARISWDTENAPAGSSVQIERHISESPLSRYQAASVLLYIPESSAASDITINLQKHTDSGFVTSQSFQLSKEQLNPYKGNWQTITIPVSSTDTISKVQILIDAQPGTDCTEEIYIGGIFISDPLSTYTGNDTVAAKVIYDSEKFSAELYADTTGAGSIIESFGETSLTSEVRAAVDTPILKLNGNGNFDLQHSSLSFGDYKISTTDRFLSGAVFFSDEYDFSTLSDDEHRKDFLTLSLVPLDFPLSVEGLIETRREQNSMSGINTFTIKSEYTVGTSVLTVTAQQSDADEKNFSYYGSSDAGKRSENVTFLQSLSFEGGSFSPSFETGFSATSDKKRPEKNGSFNQKLTLPFSIASNTVTFEYKRETASAYVPSNNPVSFISDIKSYAESFSIHADSLSILPVYDLFSETLESRLQKSLSQAPYTTRSMYNASAYLTWKRPLRADILDVFIPNSASLGLERTLSQAGFNTLDKQNTSVFVSFTAFNCMGASSANPVFTWYDQDELQYSARITLETDKTKIDLNGYTTLYFEEDDHFTTAYTGSFSDDHSYSQTLQFAWNRFAELFNKDAIRITSGSFGLKKDAVSEKKECSLEISHKADIQINENFSINGKAAFASTLVKNTALTLTLYLGAKYVF
ncbi:MAG: DNA polymerase IV [Treponema sp.]|nr:DNA polymerase IV [Candidatus Treponema caballi]